MKFFLNSIGCRLNQSEIETLGRQLLSRGHELVRDPRQADTILINTCAVTKEAARDARSQTRRANETNPAAGIVLTGCYATISPAELGRLPGSPHVVANSAKDNLLRILDPQAADTLPRFDQEPVMREYLAGHMGNTRAFVKVQDGCNNKCTFCITTVARGQGKSRPMAEIVAEIQALVEAGYGEAVLTGVHLGSYGHDLDDHLRIADLVKAILNHTDIARLRLSSLEPWDIEPDFFLLWHDRRLLPHLHLPLQSGSDAVLRRMARRTTRAAFRDLVTAARDAIPDLNLSTDIILGFPGESDEDFQQSVSFVREIEFSRLHAFTYSMRPGTAAAAMPDQIPMKVKKERTRQMIALGKSLSLDFHRRFEGQVRPVLWEQSVGADKKGLRWAGYSDNYIRVLANGPLELFNQITPTRLLEAGEDGVSGLIN